LHYGGAAPESLANGSLHFAGSNSAATYLDARLSVLRQALGQTTSLMGETGESLQSFERGGGKTMFRKSAWLIS
jgi:hypothetical protein